MALQRKTGVRQPVQDDVRVFHSNTHTLRFIDEAVVEIRLIVLKDVVTRIVKSSSLIPPLVRERELPHKVIV